MLSRREQDTYQFIRDFIAHHGHAPLLNEIAAGLGIQSKGTVHRYVRAIAKTGLIELIPGRHRGMRLCNPPLAESTSLPLLGRIAAGQPIEAIPDQEEIDLSEFFMGPNRFVLKVQGDSMIDAGILDGDMVIIKQGQRADNGAIVVALLDNEEATLKYLQHNRDDRASPCARQILPCARSPMPHHGCASRALWSARCARIKVFLQGEHSGSLPRHLAARHHSHRHECFLCGHRTA